MEPLPFVGPAPVERGYDPEAAACVAIGGIADLLLRIALAPVAEHRQNGIIEMPGAIEIVGSECNVKKHGIGGYPVLGNHHPQDWRKDQASSGSASTLRPLKPFASRNISTDSARDEAGLTCTT